MSDVNIDPSTGLPELPPGQFWRVEEYERSYYDVLYDTNRFTHKISLMQSTKRFLGSPKLETISYMKIQAPNLTKEVILTCVEGIMSRVMQSREQSLLLGDYPPKKLS